MKSKNFLRLKFDETDRPERLFNIACELDYNNAVMWKRFKRKMKPAAKNGHFEK